MTARHGIDNVITAWLAEDAPPAAPQRLIAASRARIESTQQRRAWWQRRLRFDAIDVAKLALAAAAVFVVVVVGIGLSSAGGRVGGPAATPSPGPSPSASATPSVPPARIPGLPAAGTTPSDPVPGELVLTLGSTASGQSIWVYADGRIIWSPFAPAPAGAGPSYVGFSEQRLTPSGVDFLQATVRSTGLFASDLMLAREGSYTPFVQIRLRNGSRLVEVTWAWRGIAGDAPVATAAQESALKALEAQLTDPASWPKNAWKDPVMRDYVPAEYVVCFGIPHGDAVVTARPLDILTLLPAPARDLIRIEEGIQQDGMHADYGCAQLTTDEASAFARILDDAGILRERPPAFAPEYLKYHVRDPLATNVIWIQFGAVLPQGEAVYLGPG